MFSAILVGKEKAVVLQDLDFRSCQVSLDARYFLVQSRRGKLTPLQLHHLVSHVNYAWRAMAANPLILLEGHWPDDDNFVIFNMDLRSSRSSCPEKSFEERFLSNLFTNLRDGTPSYKTGRNGELGSQALRRVFFSVSVWVDKIDERAGSSNMSTAS